METNENLYTVLYKIKSTSRVHSLSNLENNFTNFVEMKAFWKADNILSMKTFFFTKIKVSLKQLLKKKHWLK